MKSPERVKVSPTSLPDGTHGHGIIMTFYHPGWHDSSSVFLGRDLAVVLRDEIDQALDQGADRAAS